jgi:hypothetical protein
MSQYNRKPTTRYDEAARLPTTIVILLVVLAVLLIGGGLGLAYLSMIGQMTAQKQATAIAQTKTAATFATATAKTRADLTATAANANATATAQGSIAATAIAAMTATAQVNANTMATATAIAANPDPYPPGGGTLALLDPLRDNSQGNNWDTTANCAFTGGAYHVSAPDVRVFVSCAAKSTNFSNFAYEVQMQIIKGDVGGIIFRADTTHNTFYRLHVTDTGNYELLLCSGNTCHAIIATASSPAIHKGLNQANLVAVVAIGNSITLYVNKQQIASVTDGTYSHGAVGVTASAFIANGHPTEVVYSNVKVWMV